MRNLLVPARDPATCSDCAKARVQHHGQFYANCDGCVARSIAGSIAAAEAFKDGGDSGPLKAIGRDNFPVERRPWGVTAIREWFALLESRRLA